MFTLAILFCIVLACSTADDSVPPDPAHQTSEHPCTQQEALCWSNGALMFNNGSCYAPLQKGPCADGEWIRQDSSLSNQRHGGCFKRTCGEGLVEVESDPCATIADAAKKKCSGDHQGHEDAEGIFQCGARKNWKDLFAEKGNCETSATAHDLPGHSSGTPGERERTGTQLTLTCTQQEALCWNNGALMFNNGSCYAPLQKGPCADGEWIRQDSSLSNQRHGGCFERPCGEGLVEVESEPCATIADAAKKKCSGDHQGHVDAEGIFHCGAGKNWKDLFAEKGNCTNIGTMPNNPDTPKKPQADNKPPHSVYDNPPNPASAAKNCVKDGDGTCKNGAVTLTRVAGIVVASVTLIHVIALLCA